ncbi:MULTISPECIES: hypothetical protein [unclassified Streptomyces]|uniref:hypothetical protein n=1 Tax=unclassified Streptomyces TaxID=2593676 RepID=UPI003320E42D
MSHPAIHVLAGAHGHQGAYDSWGSLALDLHLLAGPEVLLPLLRTHTARDEAFLRSDDSVEAGVLVDPVRRELLLFAQEGASATMSTRSAALTLLRHAWPEWQVRWVHEGQTGLRARLGLDPADDHSTTGTSYPLFTLGPGELADVEPMTAVVTIGADRCHVLDLGADHPLAEGPDLLRRLDDAPRHTVYTARAGAGLHIDPARRSVGWWLLGAQPRAERAAALWAGWTMEFWEDRWSEHVRAAGGRFAPPAPDHAAALADVRDAALELWAGPRDMRAAVVAAAPGALVGHAYLPPVTAGQAAAARAVIEEAHRAARGRRPGR